jgi:hypothetical protein
MICARLRFGECRCCCQWCVCRKLECTCDPACLEEGRRHLCPATRRSASSSRRYSVPNLASHSSAALFSIVFGRSGDDAQYFSGRGLLLQGLRQIICAPPQLVKQALLPRMRPEKPRDARNRMKYALGSNEPAPLHSTRQISSWQKPTMHPAFKPFVSNAGGWSTNPCMRPSYLSWGATTIRWQDYRVSTSRLAESNFRYTQVCDMDNGHMC